MDAQIDFASAVVCGFDGDFVGNEHRIMHRWPIVRTAAGTIVRLFEGEEPRCLPEGEDAIPLYGSRVVSEKPIVHSPGYSLAVMGNKYLSHLRFLTTILPSFWIDLGSFSITPEGFAIKSIAIEEYGRLRITITHAAQAVFDSELVLRRAKYVSEAMKHAMYVLSGTHNEHDQGMLDYRVRQLVFLKLAGHAEFFETNVALAAADPEHGLSAADVRAIVAIKIEAARRK
ncbi:MAG: hypothetical protein P4L67_01365 [Candidatus Pacebacteria bacterium]|nr:hypothetical protein [Candidatus Paceibacterota bacterium]